MWGIFAWFLATTFARPWLATFCILALLAITATCWPLVHGAIIDLELSPTHRISQFFGYARLIAGRFLPFYGRWYSKCFNLARRWWMARLMKSRRLLTHLSIKKVSNPMCEEDLMDQWASKSMLLKSMNRSGMWDEQRALAIVAHEDCVITYSLHHAFQPSSVTTFSCLAHSNTCVRLPPDNMHDVEHVLDNPFQRAFWVSSHEAPNENILQQLSQCGGPLHDLARNGWNWTTLNQWFPNIFIKPNIGALTVQPTIVPRTRLQARRQKELQDLKAAEVGTGDTHPSRQPPVLMVEHVDRTTFSIYETPKSPSRQSPTHINPLFLSTNPLHKI